MSMQAAQTSKQPAAPISHTVIELPPADAEDNSIGEILARGNIPLLVGDKILAEIANSELREGLEATGSLNNAEMLKISNSLVASISSALADDSTAVDPADIAADAAALFVLCLRRNNVLDVDNIPACSVSFNQQDNEAQLILAG